MFKLAKSSLGLAAGSSQFLCAIVFQWHVSTCVFFFFFYDDIGLRKGYIDFISNFYPGQVEFSYFKVRFV